MPTYDYRCDTCGHTLEAFQKITDAPLTECPQCKAPALKRAFGGKKVGLHFQGSGFYITDYAQPKCGEGACGSCSSD
jgi:putative FmdB family regulatory protein